MREYEKRAIARELEALTDIESLSSDYHGKVAALLLLVIALIVLFVISMLYTGNL